MVGWIYGSAQLLARSFMPGYAEGNPPCAQALLIEAKADFNRPSKTFATPVYVAAQGGHLDCVEQLVSAGAGPCLLRLMMSVFVKAYDVRAC